MYCRRTPVHQPAYTGFSKLSGFIGELESSLKVDALRPKQNRRTARALFTQLQARESVRKDGKTEPAAREPIGADEPF